MVNITDKREVNQERKQLYDSLVAKTQELAGLAYKISTMWRPRVLLIYHREDGPAYLDSERRVIHVDLHSRIVSTNNPRLDDLALRLAEMYERETQRPFELKKE